VIILSSFLKLLYFFRSSKRKREIDDDGENKENNGENKGHDDEDLEAYMKAKRAKVADESLTTRTGM
jgi:hypothetical protein